MNIEDLITAACDGNYVSHGNLDEADCIIAFGFGYRLEDNKIEPGLSNTDLANFIVNLNLSIPLITQFEIKMALPENRQEGIFSITKHRIEGEYLNSLEVAEQAKIIMKDHDWEKALIVAHPHHIPRVDAICRKLGIITIVPRGLEAVRFDPESEQSWTRSQENWCAKEKLSLLFHAQKGLI